MKPVAGFNAHPENINRNGPPKKEWTWTGEIKLAMEEEEADGTPIKKIVAKSLMQQARKGNVRAIQEIGDRLEGKPNQSSTVNNTGEITVNFHSSLKQSDNT